MRVLAALAMVAALVTGCSSDLDLGGSDGSPGSGTVTVTGSGAVSVTAPATVRVTLAANPSTGYGWEMSVAPDPTVLDQVGEPVYEATPTDTMVVGSGGVTTFEFATVGPGTTTIELVYRRPWEEGVEPVEIVTLDVIVD